jgi:HemY protein
MISLLLLLFFIGCLGIVAAWMAENPGSVVIHWSSYQVDTSFAFLMLLVLVSAFAAVAVIGVTRRITLFPERVLQARQLKYYQQGMARLTHSVAALAAGEIESAEAHTRKAKKLLGNTPLVLLLSAQIAGSRGDDNKTRVLLEEMLGHKETEYLAARSLSDAAHKQQLFSKALTLAQRAHSLNAKSLPAVVSLHVKLHHWQEALHALDQAVRKGQITLSERRHYRGTVRLLQGQQCIEHHHMDAALVIAKQVLKDLPHFAPATAFAARAFAANGLKKKADKLNAGLIKLPSGSWACSDCNHTAKTWDAHCPSCGAFDTLKPSEQIAA